MQDESILNAIIADNHNKDLSGFDVAAAVLALLSQLNTREQDVLTRRFGLSSLEPETLESIGQRHQLTRERIRQIESGGINKIKKNQELENRLGALRQLVSQIVEEHGGLVGKKYLFALMRQALSVGVGENDHEAYFEVILSRLFGDHFEEIRNSPYFDSVYKLRYQSIEHLEAAAKELVAAIKDVKKLLTTVELIDLVKKTATYVAHQDKFTAPDNLNVGDWLRSTVAADGELLTDNRVIYALLDAMAEVSQNKYGQWGHKEWRDITPKTINDKIYLVLKQNGQPMYYGDIAKKIADMSFDGKKVNTATTHNELILDDKYVLVGRGLYGLKEWGYKAGTVSDIIAEVLKEAGETLAKEEINKRVSAQRLVKETTVNLALMNKSRFERMREGYRLKNNPIA